MTITRIGGWGRALCITMALFILLAVACAGDSKESVVRETLDCMEKNDPIFEQSMMMMFPAARDLDDAKDQYVYVSQAASLEDLKAARGCGLRGRGSSGAARGCRGNFGGGEGTHAESLRKPEASTTSGTPCNQAGA